jgi:hypothetical protein
LLCNTKLMFCEKEKKNQYQLTKIVWLFFLF